MCKFILKIHIAQYFKMDEENDQKKFILNRANSPGLSWNAKFLEMKKQALQ